MAQMAMSSTNLYHYTTPSGRDGILNEMLIRASTGFDGGAGRPVPARYGPGVYFTSYRPRNPGDNILQLIYDGGDMAALTKWENLSFVCTIRKELLERVGYTVKKAATKNGADIWVVTGRDGRGIDLRLLQQAEHPGFNLNPRAEII